MYELCAFAELTPPLTPTVPSADATSSLPSTSFVLFYALLT